MPVSTSRRSDSRYRTSSSSRRTFADVRATLAALIPPIDRRDSGAACRRHHRSIEAASGSGAGTLDPSHPRSWWATRYLRLVRKAVQYEIGNPFTASTMTRHTWLPRYTRPCESCSTKRTTADHASSTICRRRSSVNSATSASPRSRVSSTSHWVARYPPLPVEQDTLREARTGLPQRRCDLKRRLAQAKGVRQLLLSQAHET